jgi:hypothetical protein
VGIDCLKSRHVLKNSTVEWKSAEKFNTYHPFEAHSTVSSCPFYYSPPSIFTYDTLNSLSIPSHSGVFVKWQEEKFSLSREILGKMVKNVWKTEV